MSATFAQVGPMRVEIIGAEELAAAIRRYAKELELDMPTALRLQMGLLLSRNILPITPPKTRGQGQRKVKRDFGRTVRVLRPTDFEVPAIRKAIRKRDYNVLNLLQERLSFAGAGQILPFDPDWHRGQRGARGTVRRNATRHLTVDPEPVKDYLAERLSYVGQGRGGWVAGLRKFNKGGGVREWFAKFESEGEATDTLNRVGGYIRAANYSKWATGGEDLRRVAAATQSRARAIVADLEARAARAAKKAGLQ